MLISMTDIMVFPSKQLLSQFSCGNDQYCSFPVEMTSSFPVETNIPTIANIPLPLSQSVNGMG